MISGRNHVQYSVIVVIDNLFSFILKELEYKDNYFFKTISLKIINF